MVESSSGNALRKSHLSSAKWETVHNILSESLTSVLNQSFNFEYMTHVQKNTIPHFTQNKDVCVQAVTGSGKTLAFVVPMLQMLLRKTKEEKLKKYDIGAVLLAPSRELCAQIYEIIHNFTSSDQTDLQKFRLMKMIGGSKIQNDIDQFETHGANIVVATPGRLMEFMDKMRDLSFKRVEVLILDEADRLLDLGFSISLEAILSRLPKQRRTGLFSATMTEAVNTLAKMGLRNPANIAVKVMDSKKKEETSIPNELKNFYVVMNNYSEKITNLCEMLKANTSQKAIVFLSTCCSVDYFEKVFSLLKDFSGIPFVKLHGKMKQNRRNAIFEMFSKEEGGVLFTTDVCARGVDFPDVDVIYQVDPPQSPDYFIHRVGRTARAGKRGTAYLFILESELGYIEFLKNRKVSLVEKTSPCEALEAGYQSLRTKIHKIMSQDRDIIEKSKKAFVSFLRSYKEHSLSYIFQFKDLCIGGVASGLFLLRIPRVKEILGKKVANFEQSSLDPSSVPFKNSNQSNQMKVKEEKLAQKRAEKLEKLKKMKPQKRLKQTEKRQAKREETRDEWEELAKEVRLVKKLKNGKISLEDFENELGAHKEAEEIDLDSLEFDDDDDSDMASYGSDDSDEESDTLKSKKGKKVDGKSQKHQPGNQGKKRPKSSSVKLTKKNYKKHKWVFSKSVH